MLRATADALASRLGDRLVRGAWFDRPGRTLQIRFASRVRRTADTWLIWRLRPDAGDLLLDETQREPVGSTVQVAPGTSLARVSTLPDERILVFELHAGDVAAGFLRAIRVELVGSRWNAIATGGENVITAVLQLRERDGVPLRPGAHWSAPSRAMRAGADSRLDLATFRARIERGAADGADVDVRRTLVRDVAYTSPINATYIVAPIVMRGPDGVADAYNRYSELLDARGGFLLNDGRGQPYPSALGRPDAEAFGDMIDAFLHVRPMSDEPSAPAAGTVDAARAAVHERMQRIADRIAKLEREYADAAAESAALRRRGDLLFAQLHLVPRGADAFDLDDFEGGILRVELDASRSATENAQHLHDLARRRELAAERVPAMIQEAQRERAQLETLQHRLASGEAGAAEVQQWARAAVSSQSDEAPILPYRVHRTSSGLEVRVGKNSRANDDLTFHHSAPDDIWLHARDYAGAHVVLRWGRREGNPSARDIEEAAVLAATHSRGRTSGLVPVDWTRRKYVRKKRKAPPGQVVVERAKTIFVSPSR